MTILLVQESIRRKDDKEPECYIYLSRSLKTLHDIIFIGTRVSYAC